ncbi:MAG: hypothetical protein M1838_004526 [Thelocarpon superellum]|nr:MAG: hypothetical protein M1838_004526 [Thelocarpon superellum]
METTFISIHDLSGDARLLYTSDSIIDILGYGPQEVIGRSCFDYFHPDEIPFARSVHGRGVQMDKAAVLNYCRIRSKYGHWVGCECVFTVVYDVLVASTSIYRRGMKSQKRAVEAPIIRRLFSSSPRDPRYHMLSHLSTKFIEAPNIRKHEPRAALFLNRFTRTLAIMYATTALSTVLGVTAEEAKGKSFYECIQENCLPSAIRCLEGAKANDSIAYLRFWFRDPRRGHADHPMTDGPSSDEDDDGGVHLNGRPDADVFMRAEPTGSSSLDSRSSSGTDLGAGSDINVFGEMRGAASSSSSMSVSDEGQRRTPPSIDDDAIEVEAVVSCTSDGMVVVLRRARPIVSTVMTSPQPQVYTNGVFASPWAAPPIMPPAHEMHALQGSLFPSSSAVLAHPVYAGQATNGPPMEEFMTSIREVAVFAWSLTGINGTLAEYGRGVPSGEAQPPDGLPVWAPESEHAEPGQAPKRDYGDPLSSPPSYSSPDNWSARQYPLGVNPGPHNERLPVGANPVGEEEQGFRWL